MLKITLIVQEKDKSGNCTVKIKVPKDLKGATIPEKQCGAMVYDKVNVVLENLSEERES